MNYIISSFIENNRAIIIGFILTLVAVISYRTGRNHGFIPHDVLCKDDIEYLETCQKDLKENHLQCSEELIKCKSNCKIDICKPECIRQSQEAVNNYKQLMKAINCK